MGLILSSFGTIYREFNSNVEWEKRIFGISHLDIVSIIAYPVTLMKRAVIGKPHRFRIYFIDELPNRYAMSEKDMYFYDKIYCLCGVGKKQKRKQ